MPRPPTILLLDNFDSFTHVLADYLRQAGARVCVRRNDASLATLRRVASAGVVLSPGPGVPARAGCLMEAVDHFHARVPVLGVCLGHQALGQYFGAALVRAPRPVHGKVSVINCQPDPLFAHLPPRLSVVRYHSLVLESLPAVLPAIATTDAGQCMALRHATLPLRGVQFHPEAALTQGGLQLVRNWLALVAQVR